MRGDFAVVSSHRCAVVALTIAVAGVFSVAVNASAETGADQPGGPDEGAVVYQQHCAMCHGENATGMMGMHPALTGATDRLTEEGVVVTVRNGRDTSPPMPAFRERLSNDEIADVVAYIATLPDGPRNFGPGDDSRMPGMGGRMLRGGGLWMFAFVAALAAAVSGLVGYGIGKRMHR